MQFIKVSNLKERKGSLLNNSQDLKPFSKSQWTFLREKKRIFSHRINIRVDASLWPLAVRVRVWFVYNLFIYYSCCINTNLAMNG